jgi:predicted unusual protein kinase regulating ubiquinone biosynthesis (AarF/ABC1/UbiB family)
MADRLDSGRPTVRAARIAPIVGRPGQTAGETVASALRRKNRTRRQPEAAEGHQERLGQSTGVAMKAGQLLWFASVGSVMPDADRRTYRRALAGLCDDTPPVPPGLVAETVETELGRPAGQVLAEFHPVPLAVTAISQVHSAVLPDGRRVAVKVQCPQAANAMRAALARTELLAAVGQLVQAVVPGMTSTGIEAAARELSGRVEERIDLRARAAHQREFADAYRGHSFIRIPDVIPGLSTGRVLTMDLADGLGWAQARQATDALRNTWGEVIYRFTAGGLRRLRLRPSCSHQGNYLFHTDGSVTFLGFGAVERYQPEQIAAVALDIDTELACLLTDLRASARWNAIREEWDCGRPPATPLGDLDCAWRTATTQHSDSDASYGGQRCNLS